MCDRAAVNGKNAVDRSNPSSGEYTLGSTLANGGGGAGAAWYELASAAYYQRIDTGGKGNKVVQGTFSVRGNLHSVRESNESANRSHYVCR